MLRKSGAYPRSIVVLSPILRRRVSGQAGIAANHGGIKANVEQVGIGADNGMADDGIVDGRMIADRHIGADH